MPTPLYKYELTEDVVNYIATCLNQVQVRGEKQAASLLQVLTLLRTPLNAEEINASKEAAEEVEPKKEKK